MAGSSAPPRPPRASPLARGFVNVFKRNSLYAGVVFGGSFLFAIFWEAVSLLFYAVGPRARE